MSDEDPQTPDETAKPIEPVRARKPKRAAKAPVTPEERQAARVEIRRDKARRRRTERATARTKAAVRRAASPAPEPTAPVHPPKVGKPKLRVGVVTSDKATQTITVRIDTARRHRKYEKIVRSSTKLHAHDEASEAHEGDRVRIVECRPLSATKRWRLVEVLERAE
jgi:small subunit ribosomal protein S17